MLAESRSSQRRLLSLGIGLVLVLALSVFELFGFKAQAGHSSPGTSFVIDLSIAVIAAQSLGLLTLLSSQVRTEMKTRRQLQIENDMLVELAHSDSLTGLRNYRALTARIVEEYESVLRSGGELSLIVFDVDRFKQYNDSFGHPAGDEVLVAVARILEGEARSCDIVARLGGEEYAVLLPHTGHAGALVVAERLRQDVEKHSWPGRPITVSAGVSTLDSTPQSIEHFLSEADQALYFSKKAGRNRVTPYRRLSKGAVIVAG